MQPKGKCIWEGLKCSWKPQMDSVDDLFIFCVSFYWNGTFWEKKKKSGFVWINVALNVLDEEQFTWSNAFNWHRFFLMLAEKKKKKQTYSTDS